MYIELLLQRYYNDIFVTLINRGQVSETERFSSVDVTNGRGDVFGVQ